MGAERNAISRLGPQLPFPLEIYPLIPVPSTSSPPSFVCHSFDFFTILQTDIQVTPFLVSVALRETHRSLTNQSLFTPCYYQKYPIDAALASKTITGKPSFRHSLLSKSITQLEQRSRLNAIKPRLMS